MKIVRVKKAELLAILQKNRAEHREIFLEAQEGYKKTVIAELEKALEEARSGKKITRGISFATPVDQTKDYDRAIRMIEMSTEDIIELTENDFAQYVMDDWSWKNTFAFSNAHYSRKATKLVEDMSNG